MVLLVVLVLPLVSSSIFIEPLKPVYNYGDQVNVQTKIVPSVATSSHYVVDLKCETNFSANIFNNFFDLKSGVEKSILVTTELLDPLLNNMTGPCYLVARFGSDVLNSNSFVLSKEIVVKAEIEFENLNPGNNFFISGVAVKKSGVVVNGFAELFIPSLNLYKSTLVTNGIFNLTLSLPVDVRSGKHNFTLEVHNTDYNSRKINFGAYSRVFGVSQVLKEVKIHVNEENVKPQSDFIFRIDSFDQAGDRIDKDVSLTVSKPKGAPFIKKIVKSGEDQKISFSLNDSPGYWSIETDVGGVKNRKLFYLAEVNTLQTSLINNTLIVANIGNSPYSGPLEITIGSYVEVKQIKLGPGETQRFTLRAPNGDYSIYISEAGEVKNLGSAFLTGNAVKVTDFREDVVYTFTNPWIWWLGIILLILIIIFVQIKVRMKKHTIRAPVSTGVSNLNVKMPAKTDFVSPPRTLAKDVYSTEKSKFDMSWLNRSKTPISVSSNSFNFNSNPQKVSPTDLFGGQNHGIRERAVAVALYVSSNSSTVSETMNSSMHIAQEVGAKIYVDGDYKIILFSPRLTHNPDNEISAISVARRIQALFLEHMRMNNDGVRFGIGVSDGEIISEVENNKFHFTSTGNLISYAKRLAYSSGTKLFVSDSIRRKVLSVVKTDRTSYQGVWEVIKISDRSPSDFIKRFSERNR
jgi:hypothetical protein